MPELATFHDLLPNMGGGKSVTYNVKYRNDYTLWSNWYDNYGYYDCPNEINRFWKWMFTNIYSNSYKYCFNNANYDNYHLILDGTGTLNLMYLFGNNINDIDSIYLYIGRNYDDINYNRYENSDELSTIFTNISGIVDTLEMTVGNNILSLIYAPSIIVRNVILNSNINNSGSVSEKNQIIDFDTFSLTRNFTHDTTFDDVFLWMPSISITSFGSCSSNKTIDVYTSCVESGSGWFYNISKFIEYRSGTNNNVFIFRSIYSKITSLTINIHNAMIVRRDSDGSFSNLGDFKGMIDTININYYMGNEFDKNYLLSGMDKAFAATDDTFHINVKVYDCPTESSYRRYGHIQIVS